MRICTNLCLAENSLSLSSVEVCAGGASRSVGADGGRSLFGGWRCSSSSSSSPSAAAAASLVNFAASFGRWCRFFSVPKEEEAKTVDEKPRLLGSQPRFESEVRGTVSGCPPGFLRVDPTSPAQVERRSLTI